MSIASQLLITPPEMADIKKFKRSLFLTPGKCIFESIALALPTKIDTSAKRAHVLTFSVIREKASASDMTALDISPPFESLLASANLARYTLYFSCASFKSPMAVSNVSQP